MSNNQNGQFILKTLVKIKQPATAATIVSYVADMTGVHPDTIRDSVCDTLNGGVQFGFIQKKHGRYFSADIDDFDFVNSPQQVESGSMVDSSEMTKWENGTEGGYEDWKTQTAMKRASSRNVKGRARSRGKRSRSKSRSGNRSSSRRRR